MCQNGYATGDSDRTGGQDARATVYSFATGNGAGTIALWEKAKILFEDPFFGLNYALFGRNCGAVQVATDISTAKAVREQK
jgi:hypothetical protein